MTFSQFELSPALQRGISDLGFTEPTPIQVKALPPALAGRDVLAAAMTGSGKTAAFALPILQRLAGRRGGPRALVLTPTRELAGQVQEHFVALGRHTPIRSVTVIGGVNPGPQERALKSGVEVVIATPGRLLDHLSQPWLSFDQLEVLVLDEADRMMDMGFLPDVRRIVSRLPRHRQTMLFSATLPRPIVELSRDLLTEPVRLDVERQAAPATGVEQTILPVPEGLKPHLLLALLQRGEVDTALVFTRTKHRAKRLAHFLETSGVPSDQIHGNRSQGQRQSALNAFKGGRIRILVATDIAARGIDVPELPHVVNFDVPGQPEDYIHRVGRTARASATGHALTFAAPAESGDLAAIERAVGRLPRRRLENFDYEARPQGRLEIPIAERIAEIRARKSEERARAKANAERRAAHGPRGAAPAPRHGAAGPRHAAPAQRPGAPASRHGASAPRTPARAGGATAHRPASSHSGHVVDGSGPYRREANVPVVPAADRRPFGRGPR